MKYVIFSFEEGDYLCDKQNCILLFESRGLACQYIKEKYQNSIPVQRTKKIIHYPQFYRAPFKVQKVC